MIITGNGAPFDISIERNSIDITFESTPAGVLLVPVAGRDGTSIRIAGTVDTYADLPDGLGAEDRGALYIVTVDGLGYVWSGTEWPADGAGVEIQGPQGAAGRGYADVTVDGNTLVFTATDESTERVTVPALVDAETAAARAATQAGVATTQAALATSKATLAREAAESAERSAQEAYDVVAGGVPDATPTVKGGIVLAGDLGGTSNEPTVPGLATKVSEAQAQAIAAQVLDAWVGAAPEQLDTLTELASALGNDPNFASTVTAALAGKAPLNHTHQVTHVDGLQDALDSKAAASHAHTIADVSGLQDALENVAVSTDRVVDMSSVGRAVATAATTTAARNALGAVAVELVAELPTVGVPGVLYMTAEA